MEKLPLPRLHHPAAGWGTCHGKGHAAGVMLWEGVRWSGPSLGAQVLQHNQRPGWLCPGWAGSTEGLGAPWGPLSHPTPRLPLPPPKRTLFPVEVPRCRSLFRWETSPSPPSTLQKKKPKAREERNKQTNPFPLLAWHLLAVLPLLIREAAGIISNKPLLMKFRAADPGGAPRHRFSETLIKFTARRCFRLEWRQSGDASPGWARPRQWQGPG